MSDSTFDYDNDVVHSTILYVFKGYSHFTIYLKCHI